MSEEKVTRRRYVKYVGGIVVVAVVAAAGYGIYEATKPVPTTPTPTTPTPTTPTPPPTTPKPTPGKTVITYWHHETPPWRVARYHAIEKMFMDENPDIEVRSEAFPWADAPVKYPAALKAGNPPDFFFHSTTFFELMKTDYDALIPVDDIYKTLDSKYKYTSENVTKAFYFDNHYWAVPHQAIGQVMLYNQRLLDKYKVPAPLKWEDQLTASRKTYLPKEGVWGFGLPAAKNHYTVQCTYGFIIGAGGDLWDYDPAKKTMYPTMNTPPNVEAYTQYAELYKTGPPGASDWMWADEDMNFATEKIIAGLNWTCTLDAILKYNPAIIPYVRASEVTSPDGKPAGGLSGPQAAGIFKKAEERGVVDAIQKFLEFILDPKINAYWIHADSVFVPVTRATAYEPTFEEAPIMNDQFDAAGNNTWRVFKEPLLMSTRVVEHGRVFGMNFAKYPFPKRSGRVSASLVLADPLQKIIFEKMKVEDALAAADKTIVDLIAAP